MAQVAAFVFVFAFLTHGYLLGQRLFPRHPWPVSLLPGMVLFLAVQSVVQTGWYYAGRTLGTTSDVVSFLAAILVAQAIGLFLRNVRADADDEAVDAPHGIFRRIMAALNLFVAAAAAGIILRGAVAAGTVESIRTPWPILPEGTVAAIALAWLALALSTVLVRSRWISTVHGMLAVGPVLAIAPLVYRIGFGFDGFLHIASEKILLATGTLTPKPLYYIGQYVFTTWLSRLTDLPVADIDRWLVPAFATLLIPVCIVLMLRRESHAASGLLVLGLLPLAGFIATTPQGFAYALGLCALLLGAAAAERRVHPFAPLILAAWAVAAHPLAGIPILCVLIAVLIKQTRWLFVVLAGASVPILFYIVSLRGGTPIVWDIPSVFRAGPWIERLTMFWPFIGNRFVLWPAWATLVSRALPVTLLCFAVAGAFSRHEDDTTNRQGTWIGSAVALWIAATLLKTTGDFTFLIDYERGNYADRLNLLALFCLIPAAIPGLIALSRRLALAPKIVATAMIGCFVAAGTAIAYDSLPRNDALVTGRGWSTSANDIESVKLIDRDAGGKAYTVLADQSVSAAAVATLGFKRYAGDVFFYPIPTGGPLYEQFLRMTYNEPSRDTVKDAAHLGRTDLVYVVINDYWWRAEAVSEAIRDIADRDWTIGEGRVNIYRFDASKDANLPTATSTR